MKFILFFLSVVGSYACNQVDQKDSVEMADSINAVRQDTNRQTTGIISDEESADFLARAANLGMTIIKMTERAQQHSTNAPVKEFATLVFKDQSGANEEIRLLATTRYIALPDTITAEKKAVLDILFQRSTGDFDRGFVDAITDEIQQSIPVYEKAWEYSKDGDVRQFANDMIPKLKKYQAIAKGLRTKNH